MPGQHIKIALVLDNKGNYIAYGAANWPLEESQDLTRSEHDGVFQHPHKGDIVQEYTVDLCLDLPFRPVAQGHATWIESHL